MLKDLFLTGVFALKDYIATHVLTCLVSAFLLAGAMVSFINRDVILDYLGEGANKIKSFFLAACSCTVIPVVSGLYYGGAGVGVAFIILWIAPALNILALIYTGNILGGKIVVSRIIAALVMAFVVSAVMTFFFEREKQDVMIQNVQSEKKSIISDRGTVRRYSYEDGDGSSACTFVNWPRLKSSQLACNCKDIRI